MNALHRGVRGAAKILGHCPQLLRVDVGANSHHPVWRDRHQDVWRVGRSALSEERLWDVVDVGEKRANGVDLVAHAQSWRAAVDLGRSRERDYPGISVCWAVVSSSSLRIARRAMPRQILRSSSERSDHFPGSYRQKLVTA
jgi:hypothetical protein